MANYEQEGRLVTELRSAAKDLLNACDRARGVLYRYNSLNNGIAAPATCLDGYFADNPELAVNLDEVKAALAALGQVDAWLNGGSGTALNRVR